MSIVSEGLRWIFIVVSVLIFAFWTYLALIGLRPGQGQDVPVGLLNWTWAVGSSVLVSGLLPLVVAVVWALRIHTFKYFGQGALILVGLLAFHYFLFAVAAHSERGYPWVQAVEFVLFGLALWFLLKSPRVVAA